jgi:uncharacterized protein (UPF0333 family)
MYERGQVSLEFVLVTGVIFVVVISIFPYITEQNILNKAITVARDGGTYGVSMLNMGYTTNFDMTITYPNNTWKLKDTKIAFDQVVDNIKVYNITLYVDTGTDTPPASNSGTGKFLGAIATNYLHYAFLGNWTSINSNLYENGVTTGNYKFKVTVNFESG